jgi:hypothetical protein
MVQLLSKSVGGSCKGRPNRTDWLSQVPFSFPFAGYRYAGTVGAASCDRSPRELRAPWIHDSLQPVFLYIKVFYSFLRLHDNSTVTRLPIGTGITWNETMYCGTGITEVTQSHTLRKQLTSKRQFLCISGEIPADKNRILDSQSHRRNLGAQVASPGDNTRSWC